MIILSFHLSATHIQRGGTIFRCHDHYPSLQLILRSGKPDNREGCGWLSHQQQRTKSFLSVRKRHSPCPYGPYHLAVKKATDFWTLVTYFWVLISSVSLFSKYAETSASGRMKRMYSSLFLLCTATTLEHQPKKTLKGGEQAGLMARGAP